MALLRDVMMSRPKFSNFDRSRVNRFSAAPGPLYPVLTDRVLAGDTWSIRLGGDMKTYPLLSPLLGSFKQQVAFFFIPDRLYTQAMDINRMMFNPSDVKYPGFRFGFWGTPPGANPNEIVIDGNGVVQPSSILDMLGIFAGSIEWSSKSTGDDINYYNATPIIGYYDIFRNYFANTQETNCYYCATSTRINNVLTPNWNAVPLMGFDKFINYFVVNQGASVTAAWGSSFTDNIQSLNPIEVSRGVFNTSGGFNIGHGIPLGGLMLRTHRPDMLTAWLSNGTYNTMVTNSAVSTATNNSFTVNQLRFATHLLDYFERGLVAGGRYDDWVEAQFGVKTNKSLCIPELLGVISSSIVFDDVVQTGGGDFASGGSSTATGNLGDLGGRGHGSMDSRTIRFTSSESGFVMAIYSLVPNCTYSSGIKPYFFENDFQDTYAPSMDRIGFQPLMKWNFTAQPEFSNGGEGSTGYIDSAASGTFKTAVGYQPAWTELTTALNESHGQFNATLGSLNYWVLNRNFVNYAVSAPGAPQNASSVTSMTTYCIPGQFSYPFANASPIAENFLIQLAFDCKVRRAKSKSVMPTLA